MAGGRSRTQVLLVLLLVLQCGFVWRWMSSASKCAHEDKSTKDDLNLRLTELRVANARRTQEINRANEELAQVRRELRAAQAELQRARSAAQAADLATASASIEASERAQLQDELDSSRLARETLEFKLRETEDKLDTALAHESLRGARGAASATGFSHVADVGSVSASARAGIAEPADVSNKYAVFITTARRSGGTFYVARTIEGLRKGGLPAEAVTLFNVERPGVHVELEQWMHSSAYDAYPVRVIQRPYDYPTLDEYLAMSDARERDLAMQDFGFPVRSKYEMEHGFYAQALTDEPKRTYWRSKESADFAYAARDALYHYRAAEWLLFLEDDMVYHHSDDLAARMDRARDESRGMVALNPAASKAIFMQRQYLESLLGYVALRYNYYPIDWLMQTFGETIGEKPRKNLRLFDHIGGVSSFDGNNNKKMRP